MEGQKTKCLNCNEENVGIFCNNCGQKLILPKITYWEVLKEFFSSVFNIDAPFPKTFLGLIRSPGELFNSYVLGKRKSFYSPIRYMVLCLFLNLLIGKIIGFDPVQNQMQIDNRENLPEQAIIGYQVGRFLSSYLNFFLMLLPFSIAIFLRFFYRKLKFSMAESTVFGFYITGQYIILSIVPILLSLLNPNFFILNYIITIFYFSYSFYSLKVDCSKIIRVFKSFFASVFSVVFYYLITIIIAMIIMKLMGTI